MPFTKWIKEKAAPKSRSSSARRSTVAKSSVSTGQHGHEEVTVIYLTSGPPQANVIEILRATNNDNVQVFETEEGCIEYVSSQTEKKMFLVVDSPPSATMLVALESLSQIDSLFVYSTIQEAAAAAAANEQPPAGRVTNRCQNEEELVNAIQQAREGLVEQSAAFSLYNQKEKATRDLTKESGSFLFFQLMKTVLMSMPKTAESKEMMLAKCRAYYRGNMKELANISEFDLTYKSSEAIEWYTKECFVYKFINKALRTEDVEVLYHFRFYIIDLCQQLGLKFAKLKSEQMEVLKLYRGLKLARTEMANFEKNVGNLISTNGYLSTSRLRSVAYGFAKKPVNREGLVSCLVEYQVDLELVQKIVVADIAQYSAFPEEAEMLVDIGASFRIDSCTFDADDNLWHLVVQATDQGAALADEYIEYQKKKMADANVVLMFGHLLVEMGEYEKAEKYFDTILNSSNPNDEEIACIYFNFGRAQRLKGDFDRAVEYYTRAYELHIKAKPRRAASAAKTLNGLGIVYREQGNQEDAIKYFEKAMKLYKRSVQQKHVDVAGTLLNLSSIQCDRGEYKVALANIQKAVKIYKRSLPPAHPNNALGLVSLGNVHLGVGELDKALDKYKRALQMQETALPSDHSDIARTLYNIGLVYLRLGQLDEARGFLERAADIAARTLTPEHPLMDLIKNSQSHLNDELLKLIILRL